MKVYEVENRLKKIATKELNTSEGGFGGYLTDKNLVYQGNKMLVIGAVLSRYYNKKENQSIIDTFMNRCLDTFKIELGSISSAHALNGLLDELEGILKDFKR